MLAILLNVPKTQGDWDRFSLAHKLDHDEIRQAIAAKKGQGLPQYILDPIPYTQPSLVPDWLDRNQLTHQEMNGALSLSGTDLTAVDWRDDHQLQAWIFGHYLEHYNARAALAI